MNKNIWLSVIIPTYNAGLYLERCIVSLSRQRDSLLEFIVINDGSTDGSETIAAEYEKRDPRIRLINQCNRGRVEARKRGILEARGQYVTFVDSDDWVDADLYTKARGILEESQADILALGIVEEFNGEKKYRRNGWEDGIYKGRVLCEKRKELLCGKKFFSPGLLPHLCDKVFRRELLAETGFMNIDSAITYGEDTLGTALACQAADSIQVWNQAMYHYWQGNYTGGIKRRIEVTDYSIWKLLKCLKKICSSRQWRLYAWFVLLLRKYERLVERNKGSLFPFFQVNEGNRLILYGAGEFGKNVYSFLTDFNKYPIVAWVDKNAEREDMKRMGVLPVDSIVYQKYDWIIVAILDENQGIKIQEELKHKGIDEKKIAIISTTFLEGEDPEDVLHEMEAGDEK